MRELKATLLAIESSCDDTAAAVMRDGVILSNIVANQAIHARYGGIVPEVASRLHQVNIGLTVDAALKDAGINLQELDAVACTAGPGLMGSLTVGMSFAKGMSLSLSIPFIAVDHMRAHVLSHFIEEPKPTFPFLCLTVSGGHTQIVWVNSPDDMIIMGQTLDDAAGEAFDKSGKLLGLPYPAGPLIDQWANKGKLVYPFPIPKIEGFDFSFSGLKTSILYFIRDKVKKDPGFIEKNLADICASIQYTIVEILTQKVKKAVLETGIHEIGIAGGVAANSGLRKRLREIGSEKNWNLYFPAMQYCTDNAGMIAMAATYQFMSQKFSSLHSAPFVRGMQK
jgi:N6-L-threonylcarbamoyladenine synthase